VFGKRKGYTDGVVFCDDYLALLLELKLFLTETTSVGQTAAGLQAVTKAVAGDWNTDLDKKGIARPVAMCFTAFCSIKMQTKENEDLNKNGHAFFMDRTVERDPEKALQQVLA
jgi:hypothetical protein